MIGSRRSAGNLLGACLFVLGTICAPQMLAAANGPRAQAVVVDTLLQGRDARAAIADALAGTPGGKSGNAAAGRAHASAFSEYAGGLVQLERVLAAASRMRSDSRPVSQAALLREISNAMGRRLLLDEKIVQVETDLRARHLPAVAIQRWQGHAASVRARADQLDAAMSALADALSAPTAGASTAASERAALRRMLASEVAAAPIYGSAVLPVSRPRLPARSPVRTPAVVPSYANPDVDVLPVAEDSTGDAGTTIAPELLDKAQSLGYDYTRIFDFVRSQVRTEWYAGEQKGAVTALTAMAGNDIDQASLLIGLLRASGASARFVRGVVEVPIADLAAMIGVREEAVGQALVAAGIANEPIVRAGRIASYALEHTYVSAYLPYANYRGTSADLLGRTWIPLAPALKPHSFVPSSGVLGRAGIDVPTFVADHLANTQVELPAARLRSRVEDFLSRLMPSENYADQLARHAVSAPPLELLPASLPVRVQAVTGEYSSLPDGDRQRARIVVRAADGAAAPVVLDVSIAVAQLVGRRISVAYLPATIEDGAIADAYGGISATPPYLIRLRAQLNIDGRPAAIGPVDLEGGTLHRVDVTFSGPSGTASFGQVVTAGGLAALVLAVQQDPPAEHALDQPLPGDSESRAAALLANFGARYLSEWSSADDELARLVGVSVVRPFPAAALVLNQYRVDRVAGIVDRMQWRGVAIDAALRPVEPIAQIDPPGAGADWIRLSALQGSELEHAVFEQQWSVESISASKGLGIASAQGIPTVTLSGATGTGGVNHPPAVLAAISGWLAAGNIVRIPRDPFQFHAWQGSAWIVESLSTGEAGYFISGQLAGGSTALPPELWYFQDLVGVLGNPYGQAPDIDPMSGSVLTLDADSQDQQGTAGTELSRPLRAIVISATGRPVQGAAVTFAISSGTAKLVDADDQPVSQLVVLTDASGIAAARLRLGELVGQSGYFYLVPEQAQPQWVGDNRIEVIAASTSGTLRSGEPFRALTFPSAPTRLLLTDQIPENVLLMPGIGPFLFMVEARDTYGNVVSNVDIAVQAETVYPDRPDECPADIFAEAEPASLFLPGSCPAQTPILAGDTCATSSLQVASGARPSPFFAVTPNVSASRMTIRATSNGLQEHSVEVRTLGQLVACRSTLDNEFVFLDWVLQPFGYTVGEDTQFALDATRPNTVMPVSRRLSMLRAIPTSGQQAHVDWLPYSDEQFAFELTNGSAENVQNLGAGQYAYDLRGGPQPGRIEGMIRATAGSNATTFPLRGAWVVNLHAPRIEPEQIPLTPFGFNDVPVRVSAVMEPPEYVAAPVQIQLLHNGEVASEAVSPLGTNGQATTIARGSLWLEEEAQIATRVVLNEGTPFRMVSEEVPLNFAQGIVAGFGAITRVPTDTTPPGPPAGNEIAEILALIQGRHPKLLDLRHEIDIPSQYSCALGMTFAYVLGRQATVSLAFHELDAQGNSSPIVAWQALDGIALEAGLHHVEVSPTALPFGDFSYELRAVGADGAVEIYLGRAQHRPRTSDVLPLAHTIVKGVDIHSGGGVIAETDISLPGRGPSFALTRTYASHSGEDRGVFGRGWHSDLDAQIRVDGCDSRIVTGAAGQGQRFIPRGTPAAGERQFEAMHGYHGTLIQRGADYDFYALDGTRYHFAEPDRAGPRLSFIEDTNGNRLTYSYEVQSGEPHVRRITDGSARRIDFAYRVQSVTQNYGDIDVTESQILLVDALGPLGLHVQYRYDEFGNLARATRVDDTDVGSKIQIYTYADLGGVFVNDPGGLPRYYRFGHRLMTASNAVNMATRTYSYAMGWSGVESPDSVSYIPYQRVSTLTEPDGGITGFEYVGVRGLGPVASTVTDARGNDTEYVMNRYGATESTTDFAGTTTTEWDFSALQPARVVDALLTERTFDYDEFGNTTSETVQHASGTLLKTWTYFHPDEFSVPIKNRVDTATDARGIGTSHVYDGRGNVTQTTRGGVSEHDAYVANGDHASHTDGEGAVWLYRYDSHGGLRESEDPLRHVVTTERDARGRVLAQIDANGNRTSTTWDAQDRALAITYPATTAGTAQTLIEYIDSQNRTRERNPRGFVTQTDRDDMGRVLTIATVLGTQRFTWDANGNPLTATDRGEHVTSYVHDAANRLTITREPEQRTITRDYDAVGHVVRETVAEDGGADSRVTEYEYAHPLYLPTTTRRALDASAWAIEIADYDLNGNPTSSRDAEGRETTRTFDDRDRRTSQTEPLGRSAIWTFDRTDRPTAQTLSNPAGSGDQTQRWEYDAAGRVTAAIDALGARRARTLDAHGNVIEQRDARGNATEYTFDARHRLLTQAGPEAGQLVQYDYDLNGNRAIETWANGRVISRTFDELDRAEDSSDAHGVFERLTYTPDDQVVTRADGNNRLTRFQYDALHRLVRTELPSIAGASRDTLQTWTSHGEVASETDANGNTTTHVHDRLGRRTSTTRPSVDGATATTQSTYDLVGNVTSTTDGRGHVTRFTFDALNRRTAQTDPPDTAGVIHFQSWNYDQAGNAISHTDRRGIVSETRYDKANRETGQSRAGITLTTLTRDVDGNVTGQVDALARSTTTTYDKANRKTREERPGAIEAWTYTTEGDLATHTDADGRIERSNWDLRRRMASTTNGAGETTQYAYDAADQRIATERPAGEMHTWTTTWDEGGRLSSVTDPDEHTTTYLYDAHGNRAAIIDANQHTTTFAYDARHRLITKTAPTTAQGAAIERWTWDADDNEATHTTPNGDIITSTHDALGRPLDQAIASAAPGTVAATRWTWDANGNPLTIRETLADGSVRTEARSWDAFDRLEQATDANGKVLSYAYDLVGNRTELTDADGQTTIWTYDALNHDRSLTVPGQGTTRQDHLPSGRLQTITRPDGSTSEHTFDDAGRIERIRHEKAGSVIAEVRYRYDLNGNRIEQIEINGAVTGGVEQTTTYAYDTADRLVTLGEPDRSTQLVLDAVGNRIEETVTANSTVLSRSTLVYDARDRLTSRTDTTQGILVEQDWTANGSLGQQTINGQVRTYTYDARDRLITLAQPNAPPLTFDYDSAGLRTKKSQGPAETRYLYDQSSLIAETNAIGNTVSRHHYGATQLLARTEAGSTPTHRHYLLDALKTPIALLTQDGAVSARTSTDAWGEVKAQQNASGAITTPNRNAAIAELPTTDQQSIGYTGYVKDPESGLYYAKARYYDPAVARFTTQDPEAGDAQTPPSLHRYLYAYGNPTVYTDPTGRESVSTMIDNSAEGCGAITCAFYAAEYALYHVATAGFAAVHDPVRDAYDANQISEETYVTHGIGGGLAVAGVSLATGRVGGGLLATATTTAGRVGGAALLGATSGAASDAATQGVHISAGIQDEYDLGRTGTATLAGTAFGGGSAILAESAVAARNALAARSIRQGKPFVAKEGSSGQASLAIAEDQGASLRLRNRQSGSVDFTQQATSLDARVADLTPDIAPLPTAIGGTGSHYDSRAGQGLYVLYDEGRTIRYVGRGDAPARLVTHEGSVDKGDLIGEVLWTNNLSKNQAKGLEQRLIDYSGGAARKNPSTPLLNKYRSFAPNNPNSGLYEASATEAIWLETVRRLGL